MKLGEKRKRNMLNEISLSMRRTMELTQKEVDKDVKDIKIQKNKVIQHSKEKVVEFFQKVASKPLKKQMCKLALVTCLGAATITSNIMPAYASEDKGNLKPNNKTATSIKQDVRQQDLLVILIEFEDTKYNDEDKTLSNDVFGEKGDTVNNFYKTSSKGNFMFKPAKETAGDKNDGVIRVKLNKRIDDTIDEIGRRSELQKEALKMADKNINFKPYDYNNDGYVAANELDISFVIANVRTSDLQVCGFTAYASEFPGQGVTADGVKVGELIPYEIRKGFKDDGSDGGKFTVTQSNITADMKEYTNVLVHELAHTFGARDLYNGAGATSGLGYYSVMSHGTLQSGWSDFDAWTKIKLGFIKPIEVDSTDLKAPMVYTLHSLTSKKGDANIVKVKTSDPKQYFLVENRSKTGMDKGLVHGTSKDSKGGVIIYHINENNHSNYSQEGSKDYLVDIEEADQQKIGYSRLDTNKILNENFEVASDAFYTLDESGVATFGIDGVINSNLADGTKTGIQIDVLSAAGDDMNIRISVFK